MDNKKNGLLLSFLIFHYSLNKRCLKILQQRMSGILFAQNGFFYRNPPVDTQRFIQNADTTVRFGMIEIVALVLEDGCFAQYRKTVGKTLRNEELPMVFFRQFHSHVLSVSRAPLADVYRHIEHGSSDTTYQLALCIRRTLKVQSTHYTVG